MGYNFSSYAIALMPSHFSRILRHLLCVASKAYHIGKGFLSGIKANMMNPAQSGSLC
jgi:hypothetical protein